MRKMSDIVRNQDPVSASAERYGERGLPTYARAPRRRGPGHRRRSAVWSAFSRAVMPFTVCWQKEKARSARRWPRL